MRVQLNGDAGGQLAALLTSVGHFITDVLPSYTVTLDEQAESPVVIDGADAEWERAFLSYLAELTAQDIIVRIRGGDVHSETALKVSFPPAQLANVHKAVIRSLDAETERQRKLAIAGGPEVVAGVDALRGLVVQQGEQLVALEGQLKYVDQARVSDAAAALEKVDAVADAIRRELATTRTVAEQRDAFGAKVAQAALETFRKQIDKRLDALEQRRPWWKRWIGAAVLVAAIAAPAAAQQNTVRQGKAGSDPWAVTFGGSAQPVSGTVTANQGTPTTAANAWPVKFTDGTNLITAGDNSNNAVRMNCVVGCSGSSFADNAAFTFGTTAINITAGVLDDTSPNAATENSAAAARISSNRNWYFQLRDGAGNERGANVTPANALVVDGSAVTQPVSGTITANVGTFPDNEPINVAQMNGVAVTMGNGASGTGVQRVTIASDSTGQLIANAGTNLNTSALALESGGNLATVAGDTTDIEAAVEKCSAASTHFTSSAASTNATSVKGSAGQLCGIEVVNTTSTLYYLRLYNSSAAPTCSSATGFIRSIPIPHGTGTGAGIVSITPFGQDYTTGIGFCFTGGGSSTDNTNAATGVYITLFYK